MASYLHKSLLQFKKDVFDPLLKAQKSVLNQVKGLTQNLSTLSPAQLMLLQLVMGKYEQMAATFSNLIYMFNTIAMTAVRNQKT